MNPNAGRRSNRKRAGTIAFAGLVVLVAVICLGLLLIGAEEHIWDR